MKDPIQTIHDDAAANHKRNANRFARLFAGAPEIPDPQVSGGQPAWMAVLAAERS